MTEHLSDEELTDHLVGICSERVEGHLGSCQLCSNELAQVKASIGVLRSAVRGLNELPISSGASAETARALPLWAGCAMPGWAITAALVLCTSLSGVFYGKLLLGGSRSPDAAGRAGVASSPQREIERDNELLSRIDAEISESVPSSMRPLQISSPYR